MSLHSHISTSPSSSKSISLENFTLLNIWYKTWKFNSLYISLRDEWFDQEFYQKILIGENNVFFCHVTHAYFFQYCGWARKAISLKDPLFITQISMFHIKTVEESQFPSSIITPSKSCPIVMSLTFENDHLYLNLLEPIFLLLFYFLDIIISFTGKSASDSL